MLELTVENQFEGWQFSGYEAGWELVDWFREHSSREDQELSKLNDRIIEERRKRRKGNAPYQRGPVQNMAAAPMQEAAPGGSVDSLERAPQARTARSFGPCIWCQQPGHGYKYCPKFEEDLQAGRAVFNVVTRRWERASSRAGSTKNQGQ